MSNFKLGDKVIIKKTQQHGVITVLTGYPDSDKPVMYGVKCPGDIIAVYYAKDLEAVT